MPKKNKKKFPSFSPFIKDDFFNEDEQKEIFFGLEKIHELNFFLPPEHTGSAKKDGVILKKNSGYFLIPSQIEHEEIEKLYKIILKIFSGTTTEYANLGLWESTILNTSKHNILISYYENNDNYEEHRDESIFTVLMWFYRSPKQFSGGDLYLPEIEKEVKVKNNRILIIPSRALHSVSKVKMDQCESHEKMGRYCITLFLKG